jgi:hypothetical protein
MIKSCQIIKANKRVQQISKVLLERILRPIDCVYLEAERVNHNIFLEITANNLKIKDLEQTNEKLWKSQIKIKK